MARTLVMIAGESAQGKSTSLQNIANHRSVFYLGTEANKPLPFVENFKKLKSGLQDPLQVFAVFEQIEQDPEIKLIVVDSITFLMDMFETVYIHLSDDSRAEWGNYQQFFKKIMQEIVSKSSKNWLFIAHNAVELMANGNYRYYVPVKGALARQGLEAYFSIIVYARRVNVDMLDRYIDETGIDEDLLTITSRERRLGKKHVFQCDITSDMVDSRIRAPIGCFEDNQIFMDNDYAKLLAHLENYYGLEHDLDIVGNVIS